MNARARRTKPPGATTRGGWGHEHQRRRAAIAPLVNAGKATCCRCHEPIHAGEDWHLDDSADRNGYLGPAHARCNRAAAAAVTNGRRPQQPFAERPYKWSQRWRDEPPSEPSTTTADRTPRFTWATANGSHSVKRQRIKRVRCSRAAIGQRRASAVRLWLVG